MAADTPAHSALSPPFPCLSGGGSGRRVQGEAPLLLSLPAECCCVHVCVHPQVHVYRLTGSE